MDLKELEAAAHREFAKYGLGDWTFRLTAAKRRLGACKYRSKRIEIAEYYAAHNPPESVLDTLLHEIAHALSGPEAGHGPAWKAVAVRVGATPRACDTSPATALPPGDWKAECPGCKRLFQRYQRPKRLTGYRCRCASASPLTFEFAGDPARKPFVPMTSEPSANWRATCAGCSTIHFRVRKPKAGVWRCRCPHRSELSWEFHVSNVTRE